MSKVKKGSVCFAIFKVDTKFPSSRFSYFQHNLSLTEILAIILDWMQK